MHNIQVAIAENEISIAGVQIHKFWGIFKCLAHFIILFLFLFTKKVIKYANFS